MLWGGEVPGGGLELRRSDDGGVTLEGKFPYNTTAVLSDGGRTGRPRKESISSRAFAYRVNTPSDHGGKKDIHLLVGHDFNRPLASVRSGTLTLEDTDKYLAFRAQMNRAVAESTHGRDAIALLESGLSTGISPGFRLPPARRVPDAETITDEGMDAAKGAFNAIIRTIKEALLYELSIVTRPAYPESQVELRNWFVQDDNGALVLPRVQRWRR